MTAHAHDHPDFLQHHFDTPQQQFDAAKLGMWMFLATEVLLFGGLFVGYSVWRSLHPELFKFGSQYLEVKWGAINTAVLILSSLTMATAVTMAQLGRRKELIVMLLLTLAGAVGFLGIKYVEYSHKFQEGMFPGLRFYEEPEHSHTWDPTLAVHPLTDGLAEEQPGDGAATFAAGPVAEPTTVAPPADAPAGLSIEVLEAAEHGELEGHEEHIVHHLQDPDRPANAHMFFNIYFLMTGLHGIHVLVGCGVMIWLLIGAVRGRFTSAYFTPVDLGGLYWHIVDLIWIFLFPLFYLI